MSPLHDLAQFHEYDNFNPVVNAIHHDDRFYPRMVGGSHTHLSIELLFVEGEVTLQWVGCPERVSNTAVLFFSGFPHGLVEIASGSAIRFVQMPIVHVLSWRCQSTLLDELLGGSFLREPAGHEYDGLDLESYYRWKADVEAGNPEHLSAALLEIEARTRRLLDRVIEPTGGQRRPRYPSISAAGVIAAARYVARHFAEPISIDDVVDAVGWNRAHLLATFRKICGVPLWQYVVRLRTAEAQRLLATTDLPVLEVCYRAGFSSTVRMYDSFHRNLDLTPAQYRETVADQWAMWQDDDRADDATRAPSS